MSPLKTLASGILGIFFGGGAAALASNWLPNSTPCLGIALMAGSVATVLFYTKLSGIHIAQSISDKTTRRL